MLHFGACSTEEGVLVKWIIYSPLTTDYFSTILEVRHVR